MRAHGSAPVLERLLGGDRASVLARIGEVEKLRASPGFVDPNPLAERILAVSAMRGSTDPGESTLARMLFDEIEAGKHL